MASTYASQLNYGEKNIGIIRARIQTVEDIYRLIWTAVSSKQPIEVNYNRQHRLLCPHRLGRNREDQIRVLCYQYGGGSQSGLQPSGAEAKLSGVTLLEDDWHTAPNHSRPATCVIEADIDVDD